MDLASLNLRLSPQHRPAPEEETAAVARALTGLSPFEGAMRTGSFNTGIAGAMADRAVPAPSGSRLR